MKKTIPSWQIGGFLFTSVLGTFLHFLFDLAGGSIPAALVSAVNESIWEHLKLLFYPMFFFAWVEFFCWGKDSATFWCTKLKGILLGLLLIPMVYYTYTGILGVSADWFNITIFFLAAAFAFRAETSWLQQQTPCPLGNRTALLMLFLICALFTVLTFAPPAIPFFEDPITGTYGFQRAA